VVGIPGLVIGPNKNTGAGGCRPYEEQLWRILYRDIQQRAPRECGLRIPPREPATGRADDISEGVSAVRVPVGRLPDVVDGEVWCVVMPAGDSHEIVIKLVVLFINRDRRQNIAPEVHYRILVAGVVPRRAEGIDECLGVEQLRARGSIDIDPKLLRIEAIDPERYANVVLWARARGSARYCWGFLLKSITVLV